MLPLDFSEQHVDIMSSFLPRLKDGLTLVKEQNGVVDLGFPEYELEVLSSTHAAQGGEVDQQHLQCTKYHTN